ncbi:hypothetical protein FZ041_02985 [Selenomonas caprae]|uniref:Uncharacterized protein n=1 Tax=Selenomonas caprae TaxID=2606905 RepID=A0A5D6WTE4_9FIRM|nr:hypothetical protein [Selenomonas caprae]TYZ30258.1 hypothetical protein FZ041_02985 [Selenomonas caprae]
MYLNEHIFLPMVQKARQENCLDLLLAGRGEWRIIERDMLGDFPDRPTDWAGINSLGIYEIYEKGDYKIKDELEKAIIKICIQGYDDDAYLAAMAWYEQLYYENAETAPFVLGRENILQAIKACIVRNKGKMLESTKWIYSCGKKGPYNLYDFMKIMNDIFIEVGVDLFDGIE